MGYVRTATREMAKAWRGAETTGGAGCAVVLLLGRELGNLVDWVAKKDRHPDKTGEGDMAHRRGCRGISPENSLPSTPRFAYGALMEIQPHPDSQSQPFVGEIEWPASPINPAIHYA